MTTFEKQSDQPLTYCFQTTEALNHSYELASVVYIADELQNSAIFRLNLVRVSDEPATFSHSYCQVMDELNGARNINFTFITQENNGEVITHQESATHIHKPFVPNR